jgi:signal transduction histidine kinase
MNLSIRAKLLGAFGLDLLLMLALGGFAIYQMSVMNRYASAVEVYTIPSLDNANKFSVVISQYRALQLEYLINTSTADKDRIEQEMRVLERAMDGYFAAYRPVVRDAAQQQTFQQLQRLWGDFVAANHAQFLPANRRNNSGTVQPAYSRLTPLYNQLAAATQTLLEQSQQEASANLSAVQRAYDGARLFSLIDTVITIVLSALIGLVLAATIARRVDQLTSATKAVAAGDLQRRVALTSNDELGVLADNFNKMVKSLQEQHALLEQRNVSLQASLQRQQQLTDNLMQREAAEQAAVRARAAAEAANQAKSMFLATMSHELRTPLHGVLGYAQLLRLRALAAGYHDIVPDVERMQMVGQHLLSIISTILDFSKIEQGKLELESTVFDIKHTVQTVVETIAPLAAEKDNQLQATFADDLGSMQTDEGKLRQILFNLLSNATKFTEQGQVTLSVAHEWRDGVAWARFVVADTGIGMSAAQQAQLFQPFTQADSSTTRRYGGTGLGLALSHQLCQLLGGEIDVDSALGVGSTFTLRLPVHWDNYGAQADQPVPMLQLPQPVTASY